MKPALSLVLGCCALGLALRAPGVIAGDSTVTSGDSVHGKAVYARECTGCHAVNDTLVGPKHCGVFGRRAGTVPGFAYSDAMKQAGFVWDVQHLNDFLTSPITYLNGTNMGYAGLDSPQDRADVIAYLRKAMDPALCAQTAKELGQKPQSADKQASANGADHPAEARDAPKRYSTGS
jgi:cytochrome c